MARVLIVDDDPDLCRLLAAFVRRRGHESLTAGDGVAGVAQVMASAPDAVITDLNMPGMDGLEMIRHLRANGYTDIPIVVYSASDRDSMCSQAREAGAQAVFGKPGALRDVVDTVEHLLALQAIPHAEVPSHGTSTL